MGPMPGEETRVGPGDATAVRRRTDFRIVYRRLEEALARIERIADTSQMLEAIVQSLLDHFEDELGFEGGRIYRRGPDGFTLCCGLGASRGAPIGLRIPDGYVPHLRTLAQGLLFMRSGEHGFDAAFERAIGVSSTFAAIAVGEGNSHIIAFTVKPDVEEERVLYSLTAVRHVINLRLQEQRVRGMIEEARLIQESILPAAAPEFPGYDIAGESRPAEQVGGDLFDYLPLPDARLALAICDSSGHGLPAALLARDVITGLRMRVDGTSRIAPTLERLNRVIHRAALTSKFVSLFYAELRADGGLAYCNAGHNPPLLLQGGAFAELDRGGPLLGPIPEARYEVAEARLEPGGLLLLYTDGVIERAGRGGEMFGLPRLQRRLRELGDRPAAEVARAVLAAAEEYGGGAPMTDDMTVVAVRRA